MLETVIAERKLDFAREFIVSAAERYCFLCDKNLSDLSKFEIECIIEVLAFKGGKKVEAKEIF